MDSESTNLRRRMCPLRSISPRLCKFPSDPSTKESAAFAKVDVHQEKET